MLLVNLTPQKFPLMDPVYMFILKPSQVREMIFNKKTLKECETTSFISHFHKAFPTVFLTLNSCQIFIDKVSCDSMQVINIKSQHFTVVYRHSITIE